MNVVSLKGNNILMKVLIIIYFDDIINAKGNLNGGLVFLIKGVVQN